MYRQSSSRNQRAKGLRVKNILQICLLLAVCFWLIYQVKHSHDKKKEFEENDVKAKLQTTSGDGLIKLGRKDIHPRVDETDSKDDTHDDEDENTIEEDENKNDEDESEDKKVEEKDEDEAGGGDVETEEHEQEKSDAEIDREQGLVDAEEREDGEENKTQEKESTIDDTDHDADDTSSHEAREEHYKADDASSAVSHDSQIVTENENKHVENSIEQNNGEETFESENRKDLEVEGNDAAGDGHQSNVTVSATEKDTLHDSDNGSTSNNEVTEGSNDHFTSNSSTELSIENNDLPSDNSTESKPEVVHDQGNITEATSVEGSDLQNVTRMDSNSTGSAETTDVALSHSSTSEDSRLDAEEGNTSESLPEENNEFEGEKSDSNDGTDEILENTSTDNPEEVQEDAIDVTDASISMLEKEIRTDLETLPEIQTEGTSSEEVAAE